MNQVHLVAIFALSSFTAAVQALDLPVDRERPPQRPAPAPVLRKIEAQPMRQALADLSRQTGLQLIFPSSIPADVFAPAISGRNTPIAALEKMLSSSGLVYEYVNDRTISIHQPNHNGLSTRAADAAGGSSQQGGLDEKSDEKSKGSKAPAEPSSGANKSETQEPALEELVVRSKFIDTGARSAMKLDIPVRDTPFSVSSYSNSFMKAVETTNVADLYSYMVGIRRAGNTGYDLSIRGFRSGSADRNSILVNGLPGLAGRLGSPPTSAIDHVEVVKGPASVLYGQAQPGGFVNIIPKAPQAQRLWATDVKGLAIAGGDHVRSAFGYDAAVDLAGAFDADARLLYRLVAERTDRNLFRDGTYERTVYAAPGVTWNITDNTQATLSGEYRRTDNSYDLFLVAPGRDITRVASAGTRYQGAGDTRDENAHAVNLQIRHTFANDAIWNLAGRAARQQDDTSGFDNSSVTTVGSTRDGKGCSAAIPCVRMRARGQHNQTDWDYYDSNLTLPFHTFAVGHKLLLGISGGRDVSDFNRLQFDDGLASCVSPVAFNCLTVSLYDPYTVYPDRRTLPLGPLQHLITTSHSFGLYVSDVMELTPQWKLTWGVRHAVEKQKISNQTNSGTTLQSKESQKNTPMAGLLYQPNREWTFYASYATSYVPAPASAQNVNGGNPFTPEIGTQYEVGSKLEMAGGLTTATLALYRIDKKNALNSFPCAIGTCSNQVGAERSEGVELEVNAHLLDNWQLTAGYAYTHARVVAAQDKALVDAALQNAPSQTANVWSRYDFSGSLSHWGVGVGANYTSSRAGTLPSTANPRVLNLPGYGIVDLGLYYVRDRYAVTLKVGNLFDKLYYESSGFQGAELQVLPGIPRNLQLSFRAHL